MFLYLFVALRENVSDFVCFLLFFFLISRDGALFFCSGCWNERPVWLPVCYWVPFTYSELLCLAFYFLCIWAMGIFLFCVFAVFSSTLCTVVFGPLLVTCIILDIALLPSPPLTERGRYCDTHCHAMCVSAKPLISRYQLHAALISVVKIMHCIQCSLVSICYNNTYW